MSADHDADSKTGADSGPELRNSQTHDNLKAAYLAEAAASNLLRSFADMADIEGHADVSGILRELAEMELLHADGHLDFLRRVGDPVTGSPIGSTRRNLESALTGQSEQAERDYPAMSRTAQAEGFTEISDWFRTLSKAKTAQLGRIRRELDELKD